MLGNGGLTHLLPSQVQAAPGDLLGSFTFFAVTVAVVTCGTAPLVADLPETGIAVGVTTVGVTTVGVTAVGVTTVGVTAFGVTVTLVVDVAALALASAIDLVVAATSA